MADKILNTRIQLKYDSYQNWTTKNPTLLAGEVAIAKLTTAHAVKPGDTDTQAPVLFKVGPGQFNALPWASALAADVYSWAKKTEEDFITWVNTVVEHPTVTWDDVTGKPVITDTVTTVTAGTNMGTIVDNGTNGNHAYVVNGKDWSGEIADVEVFSTDITTVNAFGGIPAGADLNGMTTREILNKLLFPYVAPSIGGATASPNGGTYEKGDVKTITQVSITITKKSEPITSVALYNGSNKLAEKTGDAVKNGGTITFTNLSVKVPTDGNQLTVKVTYPDANGTAKTESKNTTALTFVYPYYYGVCADGATINEALVEGLTKKIESKGNKTDWSFTCDNQCMVFAYPKAHGVLKKIVDPNNFDITGSFTKHEVNVTGLDGTTQAYYVYVNGASTVSGFKVDFNY